MTHDTIKVAGRRIYAPSSDPLGERDLPTQAQLRAVARQWEAEKRELNTEQGDKCHPQEMTFDTCQVGAGRVTWEVKKTYRGNR